MRILLHACALLTLQLAAPAPAVHAADGELDPSFGDGGVVLTDLGVREVAAGVALQPDGKIVIAGHRRQLDELLSDFAVVRYLPDGALDSSFGDGGVVITDVGSSEGAGGIAVQPDGKIVLAGASDGDLALLRYLPDGSLDPAFGVGGVVRTDFGGRSTDSASAVGLLPDGRIVAAGSSNVVAPFDFALARYLPNGSLDASFGVGGRVVTDASGDGNGDAARAMVLLPDGRAVVTGTSSSGDLVLVGYAADGSLDPGFGDGGIARYEVPDYTNGHAIARRADGRLVAVASRTTYLPCPGLCDPVPVTLDLVLGQFLADGSPDPAFGTDGLVVPDLDGLALAVVGEAVALLDDGGIVVAGRGALPSGGSPDAALLRFTAEGELDPRFGSGGVVLSDFNGVASGRAQGVVVQPDGRIVIVAWATGSDLDFLVARYTGSGSPLAIPALGPLGLAALAALIAALALGRLRPSPA